MSKQTDLLNLTDAITVDGSNNVGIGTSSPSEKLTVAVPSNSGGALFYGGTQSDRGLSLSVSNAGGFDNSFWYLNQTANNSGSTLAFGTRNSEAMRLDSSGNLLVGKSSSGSSVRGSEIRDGTSGFVATFKSDADGINIDRSTDGSLINLRKSGTTVGSIGAYGGDVYIGTGDAGLWFQDGGNAIRPFRVDTQVGLDNSIDLGHSSNRFDDIYATNGSIQTSDRNEKQDIEALSDAEQRVAVACKGLLRKFRWIDAVAEKGDDARIHFGIIAQDLQDAFAAEGLDAGRYAMFISSTWWEATETYTDDDGVEQTRVNTYETAEEAPEGATERTRLGVRYPELLAFIIGAT